MVKVATRDQNASEQELHISAVGLRTDSNPAGTTELLANPATLNCLPTNFHAPNCTVDMDNIIVMKIASSENVRVKSSHRVNIMEYIPLQ